jgi:hypothetical protein
MGGGVPPFNQCQIFFIPRSSSIENYFRKPSANYNPCSSFQVANQSMMRPRVPFLKMMHFLDLSKLMKNPICHDLSWQMVPTKLPSDIPKFKGKSREDP